jgi:hypothetical protein
MPVSGYCVSSIARVGSDGNTPGTPELTVGQATGRKTWDSNLQDGLDSGWVALTFTAKSGGGNNGVTLNVGGVNVVYSDVTYGDVNKVMLSAFVDGANKRMSFRSVVVEFYDNDTDEEPARTIELPDTSAPIASTMGMSGSVSDERTVGIVPDQPDAKVIVYAEVRLESTSSSLPAADSIAGGVYLFTNSCV